MIDGLRRLYRDFVQGLPLGRRTAIVLMEWELEPRTSPAETIMLDDG